MATLCPCCHQPPRLDRMGDKPARINGEIVFTAFYNLATCLTPGCPMWQVTKHEDVYRTMTETEAKAYMRGQQK